MLLFASLLPLTIGLTIGQPKQSPHPFANYSPRRSFEQAVFDPSLFDPSLFDQASVGDHSARQFLNGQYFHAYPPPQPQQHSIIEPRSSEDSSSIVQPPSSGHHHTAGADEKLLNGEQPLIQYNPNTNGHHAFHQLHHQPPTGSSAHHGSPQFDRFNHYDLDSTVYHASGPPPPSRHHNQQAAAYSTTPVPILRLKNTKIDGKLSPTLIITLPKKRKSNGKSRRFPFLKAIVSSFISTDRRTTGTSASEQQNKSHQPPFKSSQQMQAANSVSSKLELPNANNPNEYAASHPASHPASHHSRSKQQLPASAASGNVQVAQLRSQSSMAVSADANGNSNANGSPAQLQGDNPNGSTGSGGNSNGNNLNHINNNGAASQNTNQNSNPNGNPNNNTGGSLTTKEDGGKPIDGFEDELDDEDEDEFNEWSEAPRPQNFDDNQYWIESNKIKYASASGQEPVKQPPGDHLGQGAQSSYTAVSQQGSIQQKKPAAAASSTVSSSSSSYNNNKHTSTSPDFESTI